MCTTPPSKNFVSWNYYQGNTEGTEAEHKTASTKSLKLVKEVSFHLTKVSVLIFDDPIASSLYGFKVNYYVKKTLNAVSLNNPFS